ncbi:DivIVA domain-containing protein [Streptomyces sp. NBC_00984]|uniref:DivIVA domain-containing protein n=1 Tax=Streptomyces sp. NBC_00984 TaxID=2903700 RepID=UPI00386A9AEC|nr:DivIVA domain-containing protein [Streptomyces sp. NBC_00984]
MRVFWFLLVTMVVVVAAVTLAVVGGGKSAVLQDVAPEQLTDPLPATRPVGRADVDALRLPVAVRGYRMMDVDEALDRLSAELSERDARIAELESALVGAQATAVGGPGLIERPQEQPQPGRERPEDRPEEQPQQGWEGPEDRPQAPWEAPRQDPRPTEHPGEEPRR